MCGREDRVRRGLFDVGVGPNDASVEGDALLELNVLADDAVANVRGR